ncbi:hypothetical protein EPR50_G00100710 [Perca flavescens]|uniref:Uncharacterized protein n=1 Tax=Perca flavescens TaxID=8167 RepID=A0A484D0B9_PERFV|nr:hypothetical protein EPR50_G00100710 [Perca flavescens]
MLSILPLTFSSFNMPAAMHLTVLVSLFAVTLCENNTTSSTIKLSKAITISAAHHTSLAAKKKPLYSMTEETHPSVTPPQTTTTNQTSNQTVFHGSTLPPAPESPNITATITVNITSPGLSHGWEKDDIAANPGLVAILCIFCIIVVLVLVVISVKCIQSPRSNFERLEDVPMRNVTEESPFAQYSK